MLKLSFKCLEVFYTLYYVRTEQKKDIKVTAVPYRTLKKTHVPVTKPFNFQMKIRINFS